MATKKKVTKKKVAKKATRPVAGSKPVDPAVPVTPPDDPTKPITEPPPGVDPVVPDPNSDPDTSSDASDDPAVDTTAGSDDAAALEAAEKKRREREARQSGSGLDPDNFDPSELYPELAKSPEGFETAFPDLEQPDYWPAIKAAREEAQTLIEKAEQLEADYRARFPQHRELKVQDQNAINQVHARLRRKKLREERAKNMPAVRKVAKDFKNMADFLGGSRLDRVLKQRGKDPSLRRKPARTPRG